MASIGKLAAWMTVKITPINRITLSWRDAYSNWKCWNAN